MKKVLLILILVVSSCGKDKKEEMIHNLTNDGGKYWDLVYSPNFYDKSKSLTFPMYCYYFDNKGNLFFYTYKKEMTRERYHHHDIQFDLRWYLLSDTTIMLWGAP